jgi:hypothetical protein
VFNAKNNQVQCPNILSWAFAFRTSVADVICAGHYHRTASLFFSLMIAACTASPPLTEFPHYLVTLAEGPLGADFSLVENDNKLHLLFADYKTLSLRLLILDDKNPRGKLEIEEDHFLDRVGFSPVIDPLFGNHIYLVKENQQHLFYLDQEGEDIRILKWIRKALSEEKWYIDAYPFSGKIISAIINENVDIFFHEHGALYHLPCSSLEQEARNILSTSSLGSEASLIQQGSFIGFTIFDGDTKKLQLITPSGNGYKAEALIDSGEIHYSTIDNHQRLQILIFSKESNELTLYRQNPDNDSFELSPVTLSRGTRSVFLFNINGMDIFLFSESGKNRNQENIYQLAMLFPQESKYTKEVILQNTIPISGFKALLHGHKLYIALLQESLAMLVVDLKALN